MGLATKAFVGVEEERTAIGSFVPKENQELRMIEVVGNTVK